MKAFVRTLLASAVLALAAPLASAQSLTLTFEGLPGSGFFNNTPYQGFNFSNATGTSPNAWYWGPGTPNYPAIGNTNISATPSAPGVFDAFVISSPVPFSFQSAFFSGCCGPIGIELVDTNNNSYYLGSFAPNGPAGLGLPGPSNGGTFNLQTQGTWTGSSHTYNFVNTALPNLLLKEVAIWGEGNTFAVDNIGVSPIPEPSTYALMGLGLAGVVFAARRRRKQQTA